MFKLILLSIFGLTQLATANHDWPRWDQLVFKKGDLIACYKGGSYANLLLATSDKKVIHMAGNQNTGTGRIVEEPWRKYHNRVGARQTLCRVQNAEYDAEFEPFKPYAKLQKDPVGRARADMAKMGRAKTWYDINQCNSEHWVTWWRYGLAYSYESKSYPSPECYEDTIKNVSRKMETDQDLDYAQPAAEVEELGGSAEDFDEIESSDY